MSAVNLALGDKSEQDSMTIEVDYYDLQGDFAGSDIFLSVGQVDDEDSKQVSVLDADTAEKIGRALLDAATEKRVADFKRTLA